VPRFIKIRGQAAVFQNPKPAAMMASKLLSCQNLTALKL
jgi:hypothetical protein